MSKTNSTKSSVLDQLITSKRQQAKLWKENPWLWNFQQGTPDPVPLMEEEISFLEEIRADEERNQGLEPLRPENPIRWRGSASDLVELFAELRQKRYIRAASEYELFAQIVLHFATEDGQPFSRDNLKRSLSSRRCFGSNEAGLSIKFGCIVENKQTIAGKSREVKGRGKSRGKVGE